MSTSLKYIAYLTLLHLALGVAAYFLIGPTPWLLVAEAGLLLSAYAAYRLYRQLVAPVSLLSRGAGALADQDFSVKMTPTGSPEMDRLAGVYNRMIDQLRQERVAGRQREEFLDQLIEAAEVGVVVLDFDGGIQSENSWVTARRQRHPDFTDTVLQPALALDRGAQRVVTTGDNRRLHIESATFIDRGFERGFLLIQDVTAELLEAEKEAYGKVIRMMAHEVNNSNAAITSLLRTLLEAARSEEPGVPRLVADYVPTVIERAEGMTAFMRNFARVVRLPPPRPEKVDLNEVLRGVGRLLHDQLRQHHITLTQSLHPSPVVVRADRTQLEQVVINAITNARESIGTGGEVRLTTLARPAGFEVADDGPGIDPADSHLLFTPFFSTKANGQGVGLTLSREILSAHGTDYRLRTGEDGWTRFQVRWRD